jgi:hypothetical protein
LAKVGGKTETLRKKNKKNKKTEKDKISTIVCLEGKTS